MDNSPTVLSKRPNRLSITKTKNRPASPTTSCLISTSPSVFSTPPSKRLHGDSPFLYSTPINQRIRSKVLEESPSQDYDIDATCSQDDRENILDVGWKWESHVSSIAQNIMKNQPKRMVPVRVARTHRSPHLVKLPVSVEKKGFYKFKEELSKLLSNGLEEADRDASLENDDAGEVTTQGEGDDAGSCTLFRGIESIELKRSSDQHSDDIKENPKQDGQASKLKLVRMKAYSHSSRVANISPAAVERGTNLKDVNLFDQSDLDNLLLQCSQKVEENYREQSKKPNLDDLLLQRSQQIEESYQRQIKKQKVETNSLFGNDSFDDLFLSVPIDEKLVQNTPSKHCRSPLVRHRSMPTKSPAIKNISVCVKNSFIRHNSMPPNDNQQSENNLAECSKPISSESDALGKHRCTAEEIEKKRLEALQRREASKLKKVASCPNSSKAKR